MAKAKVHAGVFENMEFPEYKFEEYPKVVGYRDEKKTIPIIVNDSREEIEFISKGKPGTVRTREEELKDELEKNKVELELAKEKLKEMKEPAKPATPPLPIPPKAKE